MSDQIRSDPLTPPVAPPLVLPPRGVSRATLLLSVLLAVAVTAAVVLGVFAFRAGPGKPTTLPLPDPSDVPTVTRDGDVYIQRAAVKPETATGHVIYPMPYAMPPHLMVTSDNRKYTVVKQDETGFSWAAGDLAEDLVDVVKMVAQETTERVPREGGKDFSERLVIRQVPEVVGKKKRDIIDYERFTWEARGVRFNPDVVVAPAKLFEQEGTFRAIAGEQGDVNFPFPYALPPNVELTGNTLDYVVLVETKPTGFKWKHKQPSGSSVTITINWKAKGIKATTLPK